MGGRKTGAAFGERAAGDLGQRLRAIRRQRVKRDIPAIVLQPELGVAAGARYFEALRAVLEQNDVICKAAKATEHHVFVSRQFFAGAHRGLPFALEDRNIIKHLRRGFLRRFPGGEHGIPQQRASSARNSVLYQCGWRLRGCKNSAWGKLTMRL